MFKLRPIRNFESEEEKAIREKEAEEKQKEYKMSLEKQIGELEESVLVKYARKILAKSYKNDYEGLIPESQAKLEYGDKAKEIAECNSLALCCAESQTRVVFLYRKYANPLKPKIKLRGASLHT